MAQAYASATGSSCAFGHELTQVVQNPLSVTSKEECTTPIASADYRPLTRATMRSLRLEFSQFGHSPSTGMYDAIEDVVSTFEAMADGTCKANLYLSSLDPGVGKTSAVKHFIRQLLHSTHHEDVAVLVCLGRKDEIKRLVEDMELDTTQYAVFTRDPEINGLSSTKHNQARVLFTTHQMVESRCYSRSFAEAGEFHFKDQPRTVRIWDEEMLPGRVVTLSEDALGSLLAPLRPSQPQLAELVSRLQQSFSSAENDAIFVMPDIVTDGVVAFKDALKALGEQPSETIRTALEDLYRLSGRTVKLFKDHRSVVSALNTRDTLPSDLAPIVVLDASGRVRHTYELMENCRGGLVRLKEATKHYGNLTIKVMDHGGSKDTWWHKGDQLLQEIINVINSKPDETWLIVYHMNALSGKLPKRVREMIKGNPARISFIHWGAHQGTNAYSKIANVILAGTLFLPEWQYRGLSHLCANIPVAVELPDVLIKKTRLGEHRDLVLQALCRASVRGSIGNRCAPCNAYIIAAKQSGIRKELSTIFPGCKISDWQPVAKKLKGQKAEAEAYVRQFFQQNPDGVLPLLQLRNALKITNTPNFNKAIRKHKAFKAALDQLGVIEVVEGNGKRPNALKRLFGPVPGSPYVVDV